MDYYTTNIPSNELGSLHLVSRAYFPRTAREPTIANGMLLDTLQHTDRGIELALREKSFSREVEKVDIQVPAETTKPSNSFRFEPFRRIEFPCFNGENPRVWIDKANNYFQVISTIPEDKKVDLAAYIYFEGEAKLWFRSYIEVKETPSWNDFIGDVLDTFDLAEVNQELKEKEFNEPVVFEKMHMKDLEKFKEGLLNAPKVFDKMSVTKKLDETEVGSNLFVTDILSNTFGARLMDHRFGALLMITSCLVSRNAKRGSFLNGVNQIIVLSSWHNGIGSLDSIGETWSSREFCSPFDQLRSFWNSAEAHYFTFCQIAKIIFISIIALVSSICNEDVNRMIILLGEITETGYEQLIRDNIQDLWLNIVQVHILGIDGNIKCKSHKHGVLLWTTICPTSKNTIEVEHKKWRELKFVISDIWKKCMRCRAFVYELKEDLEGLDRTCNSFSSVKLHILHLTEVETWRIRLLGSYFSLSDITKFTSQWIACLRSLLNKSFNMEPTNLRRKFLREKDIGSLEYRMISTNNGLEISCATIVLSVWVYACSHQVYYCFIRVTGSDILRIKLELPLRTHLDIHFKNFTDDLDTMTYKPIEHGCKYGLILIQERPTYLIINFQQPPAGIFESLASVIVNEFGVWRKKLNTKMIHLLFFVVQLQWMLAYINPKYAETANGKMPRLFLIQGLCLRIKRRAIHFFAQGYKDFGPSSFLLTPYLPDILNSLIMIAGRTDCSDSKLKTSAYKTLNEVVRCSNLQDTSQIIAKLFSVVMSKLGENLSLQILSSNDEEKQGNLESSVCGMLQVITEKLSSAGKTKHVILYVADQIMLLLNVFAYCSATVHEKGMLVIGALAYATGLEYGIYMQEFYKNLEMGLQNFEEYHVCAILVGIIGDNCHVLDDKNLNLPYSRVLEILLLQLAITLRSTLVMLCQ